MIEVTASCQILLELPKLSSNVSSLTLIFFLFFVVSKMLNATSFTKAGLSECRIQRI